MEVERPTGTHRPLQLAHLLKRSADLALRQPIHALPCRSMVGRRPRAVSQREENHIVSAGFLERDVVAGGTTHGDGRSEQPRRTRDRQQVPDGGPSRALPRNRHPRRVPAEGFYVALHPAEGRDLVGEAEVAGGGGAVGGGERLQRQEALDIQAVVDGDDDDALAGQPLEVDVARALKDKNGRKTVKSAPYRPILSANRRRQRPTHVYAGANPA